MKTKDYEIAKQLKEQLSFIVSIIDFRVLVQGVRGDENKFSDMDIFIEVEQINKQLKKKSEI